MNILQIASDYIDRGLYKKLFSELACLNVKSFVVAPVNGKKYLNIICPEALIVPCISRIKRFLFYPKQKIVLRSIKKNLNIGEFDAIHAHTLFSCGFAAWKLHCELGTPYIVAVRNTDKNVFFKYMFFLRQTGVKIMQNAYKIIFISPAYKKDIIENYIPEELQQAIAAKSEVIPNGIDRYFLDNLYTRSNFPQLPLKIIYVGEIDHNKNVTATIKAVESLNERGITAKLKIVGKIKEEKYRALFAEIPFVEYFEPCCKEEVVRHLRTADIFVMPSFYETFGLVYAEALSQGLPVVYTKGQGFDGQFPEGEVGYHVDPHNPQEIAEKIVKILNNYNEISRHCTENSRFFDWNEIAKRYKLIYSQLH